MAGASSLHRSLLARILLCVLPIVLASMGLHWFFERRLLASQFDEELVEKAEILATLVTRDGERLELEFADEFMPQYSRAERPYFFQIRHPDGRNLERSYSLQGEDLPLRHGTLAEPASFEATLASGAELRCVGIAFPARLGSEAEAGPAGSVTIVLAAEAAELDRKLRTGYAQVALTGLASAAAVSISVLLALRRGLSLLRGAVAEVERVTPDSLQQPLDERRAPEEIRPIVAALNRSLAAIRDLVERERRFTADVAHELRTPIAELRAAADVALRWPDEESRSRLADDARAIAAQMGALVESLLELAVLEAEAPPASPAEVDLVPLVRRLAEQDGRARPGQTLELDLPPELRIATRAELWEVVLRNLLDNAHSHSPDGARIRVSLRADGGGAALRVSNPTDARDPELARRCTERLWRGTRDARHFGLGLSIVQAACARLGHRLRVRVEGGEFHADVRWDGPAPAPERPG